MLVSILLFFAAFALFWFARCGPPYWQVRETKNKPDGIPQEIRTARFDFGVKLFLDILAVMLAILGIVWLISSFSSLG